MLLTNTLPALAFELQNLLTKKGRLELAAQVRSLQIVDRCRCGDDFCASSTHNQNPQAVTGRV